VTANQIRAALDHLGLTQVAVAQLFGVEARSVRRWVSGDSPVPDAVAVVLRLVVAGKITLDDVEAAKLR